MRSILPHVDADVDPLDVYVSAARRRPEGRPWVAVGMVSSLDGATVVDGVSGGLGGDGDRHVFRAARAMADVILVGAATVRAENYGPVKISEAAADALVAAGRTPAPAALAIVSGTLALDPDSRVFETPPVVFTTAEAAERDGDRFAGRAEIVPCGEGTVDLAAALAHLSSRADLVVCEGGPNLVGQLVELDVVDEWCVNVAATVAGGPGPRLTTGAETVDQPVELVSALVGGGVLATRWLRRRDDPDSTPGAGG